MTVKIEKKVIITMTYNEYLDVRGALIDASTAIRLHRPDFVVKAKTYDKVLEEMVVQE